ncbi:hypothetical protein SDJN03_13900, partial [Cucurbita argyrosperma subsp. sororia]
MVTSSSSSKTRSSGPVLRSHSPGGRFCNSSSLSSSMSAFASSTSSNFYSSTSTFRDDDHRGFRSHHHQPRSTSPSRVNVYSSPSLTPSVRFFIDNRSSSPNRSVIVSRKNRPVSNVKRTCMCSPTTHPGSFRCSLHKNVSSSGSHSQAASFPSTSRGGERHFNLDLVGSRSCPKRTMLEITAEAHDFEARGTESARRVLYAEKRSVGIPSVPSSAPFVVILVPVVSRVPFTPSRSFRVQSAGRAAW